MIVNFRKGNKMERRTFGGTLFVWLLGLVCICGIHRMYTGRVWTGLLWLFTFGLFGIGQIIDLFLLPYLVQSYNSKLIDGGIEPVKEKWLGPIGKTIIVIGLIFAAIAILATVNSDRDCLSKAKNSGLGNGESVAFCQKQVVDLLKNNP